MLLWEYFSASGKKDLWRFWKLQAVSSKTGTGSYIISFFQQNKDPKLACAKPWPESHWYSYRVDLRPRSIPEEHQIWRTPSDLPKENGLGLLIDVCEISSKLLLRNGCRLLSSKKDTQLTISIRRVNNFVPGKKQRNQKMLKNDFVKYFCFCVQSKIM